MFTSPFAPNVGFAVFDSRSCTAPSVLPEEAALLPSRAIGSARIAFSLGRHAAHSALSSAVLVSDIPILRLDGKAPRWPDGAVGSISHTRRGDLIVAAAIAAPSALFESLGLDIEDLRRPISPAFVEKICTARELTWVNDDLAESHRRALRLFSAKETLFKMFAPVFSGPKTFQGADLIFRPETNSFEATIAPAISDRHPAFSRHHVFVQEREDFVLTAAALER